MNSKLNEVIVVKIGGSTLSEDDTTVEDIVELQKRGKSLVIVHGGGKLITEWLARQNVSSSFVRGERVTDKPTLEVVTAVLSGLVNKGIVAAINGLGGKAAGISGVDGALIEGQIDNIELGHVGAVANVNTAILEALLASGYIPVVAPVSSNSAERSGTPQLLNINADTAAGAIAAATSADELVFLTDVAGICDRSGKLLSHLSPDEAEALIASGVAAGGMIPKIKACLEALSATSTTCIIDGRKPHALLMALERRGGGTTIQAV